MFNEGDHVNQNKHKALTEYSMEIDLEYNETHKTQAVANSFGKRLTYSATKWMFYLLSSLALPFLSSIPCMDRITEEEEDAREKVTQSTIHITRMPSICHPLLMALW